MEKVLSISIAAYNSEKYISQVLDSCLHHEIVDDIEIFVIDDGGTERSCNCLQKSRMITSDLVSGGERLFHKIIIYQIWVEIDEETRYNVPMVVDRDVKTNQVGD